MKSHSSLQTLASLAVFLLLLAPGSLRAQQPGDVLWSTPLEVDPTELMNRPEVGPDGAIHMFINNLFVVNPDGSLRHQIPVGTINTSDVAVDSDGRIFVGAGIFNPGVGVDDYVIGFAPTGEELWRTEITGTETMSYGPTLGPDGNLYGVIGTLDSGLGAFSVTTDGDLRWNVSGFEMESILWPNEVPFAADRFYVANESVPCQPFSNGIAAFSFDGEMLWCLPWNVEDPPVVGPDGSAYGLGYNSLTKFSPDGDLLWRFNFPPPVRLLRPPSMGPDGTVYVQEGWWLWAFNPDGSVRYEAQIIDSGTAEQATVSPDGTVLLVPFLDSGTSEILALDPPDASELWRVPLPDVTDPPYTFSAEGDVVYVPMKAAYQEPLQLVAIYVGTSAANPTGAEEAMPGEGFALSSPHPNPFAQRVRFTIDISEAQDVTVIAYDVLGRRVAVLHEGRLSAGEHALTLEGTGLAPGPYVVRAAGEGSVAVQHVTLLR